MKIFIISDMHKDITHPMEAYWKTNFAFLNNVDVMVIAGDNGGVIENLIPLFQLLLNFPKLHIVYVPGNHDFYGINMQRALDAYVWLDYSFDRLHFLTGEMYSVWEYGDFVFIGATLWTDFNNGMPGIKNAVQKSLHDYDCILTSKENKRITADNILNEHGKHRKNIFKYLNRYPDKRRIVVTHHKPYLSPSLTDPEKYGYEVDLSEDLTQCENPPELWIYGHTHKSDWKEIDTPHGHIIFVSNPLGYASEDVSETGFRRNCILEL